MTSFQFDIGSRARNAGRFIGRVRDELVKALSERKKDEKLSQQELAKKLEVHRSLVNRQLSGEANLTLRSLADLAWAMDMEISFELKKPVVEAGQNQPVTTSDDRPWSDQVYRWRQTPRVALSGTCGSAGCGPARQQILAMRRYGYSIFCDDIRSEAGGKLSFIGCYNAVMMTAQKFPLMLPKFCIHFHVFSPATQPYTSVTARCYVPGEQEPIAEEPIEVPGLLDQQRLLDSLPKNITVRPISSWRRAWCSRRWRSGSPA